ncbi:MAG: hypothetical protein KOO65_08785, partial [Desulfobacterales bacterium]|nr:hypothetical protein [Desulfobacterales bacterium]
MMDLRSCVGKNARFIVGIHKPRFEVKNLRDHDYFTSLGQLEDGTMIDNSVNFPGDDLYEPNADVVYEIANQFPFRGATYINSAWADIKAAHPETIRIPAPESCSLLQNFEEFKGDKNTGTAKKTALLDILPHPLLIALAQASTDPKELILLAKKSCNIIFDPKDQTLMGIGYKKTRGNAVIPDIYDHELFEVLVNNRYLPDDFKNALVLKPGVQGNNEITGEYLSEDGNTHVFEYLRRNSYIPWGHFASNMANDAIRYSTRDLCLEDMKGIRHLYYQRAFIRLASELGICLPDKRQCLTQSGLENLRNKIQTKLKQNPGPSLKFDNTLWGWNFGYGYAQSGHRLHASHQMIHQQNAMTPKHVQTSSGQKIPSFSCGDLINDFTSQYRKATGKSFFGNYLAAIRNNTRTDGKKMGESSLVLMEDEHTILFVPKAQICEWELQLMPKTSCGNIIETDINIRQSLDRGILTAVKTLESLGAQLVTSIEFSKRFDSTDTDQHLLYSFIPRLPHAPDTFSEAQLRWISGCYPEDFARACRMAIKNPY